MIRELLEIVKEPATKKDIVIGVTFVVVAFFLLTLFGVGK